VQGAGCRVQGVEFTGSGKWSSRECICVSSWESLGAAPAFTAPVGFQGLGFRV
jgi:hypothetical protein